MVSILKGYRAFLLPIVKIPTIGATDTNSLFNLQLFLRSRDKSHQKFYSLLTKTQMFIRFIEERSFVSDLDAGLAFFDECIEKVEQEDSDTHLIELDESHQSERTVFISPPEQNGVPHSASPISTYWYQNEFTLNLNSFVHKGFVKNLLETSYINTIPSSPMARRSKYEVKCAQKLARKYFCSPDLSAKCLLGTCYSLWFIHLPSFVLVGEHKVTTTLRIAYELLFRIQKTGLQPTDEVCYRVMMQLCGVYNQPMLAVKLLILMKRGGMQPNAVTYGFYNRAVLESTWPSNMLNPSQLLWNKLRNVIYAAALFRQVGRQAGKRRLSVNEENCLVDGVTDQLGGQLEHSKQINATYASSGGSVSDIGHTRSSGEDVNDERKNDDQLTNTNEKIERVLKTSPNNATNESPDLPDIDDDNDDIDAHGNKGRRSSAFTSHEIATFDKFCSRMGNIVKPSGMPLRNATISINQQSFESSAGLLMTGTNNMIGFAENEPKVAHSEKTNHSLNSSPRARVNMRVCKRNRSDSCSEFTYTCSPRNNRKHYSYYSPQTSNSKSHPPEVTTDFYHLLTRSESFANDAQILKNLQEIKQKNNEQSKSKNYHPFVVNKSIFGGRRGSANLQKLKESSKNESRASSIETLPSSGAGSMDDIISTCSNATKRLMTSKVLAAIGTKLNSVAGGTISNENHLRKFSVSSLEDAKKQSTESLSRVSSTPSLKSPVRTPVTENDPLGALSSANNDTRPTDDDKAGKKLLPHFDEVTSATSKIELDQTGAPVLFDRRKKRAGASFHRSASSGIDKDCASIASVTDEELLVNDVAADIGKQTQQQQRSSTMPADARSNAAASQNQSSPFKTGLGNLGSNFKLPFSPGSLTGKKSNEFIMGGLSSLKNAASSMAKKIDEIKEAMSANATPLKDGAIMDIHSEDDVMDHVTGAPNTTTYAYYSEETPVKRKISSEFSPSSVTQQLDSWSANLMDLFSDGSRKGSSSNLQPLGENSPSSSQQALALLNERLYPKTNRSIRNPVALELIMSTCSKCHHCGFLLYDEEIMAGWLPEDSNLNTKCSYCDKAVVPFLYVTVLDYRNSSKMSQFTSEESMSSLDKIRRKSSTNKLHVCTNSVGGSHLSVDSSVITASDEDVKMKNMVTLDPIIVPYLNPLVLRKELESILNTEGDTCLTESTFVDEHPIVYWNMVWVFERIAVTSHMPSLCLNSHCVLGDRNVTSFHPSWSECDHNNIVIRTLWDNPQLYDEVGYPMYVLWSKNDKQSDLLSALLTDNRTIPRSLMERVISCIQCNDLLEPLKRVAAERTKLKSYGINHNYSLYRDILFLSFVALGRENIDQNAFDKEYVYAYEELSPADKDSKIFWRCDNPNLNVLAYFRNYFKELEI